jgi:GH24 family phage-related lysozyme (muramidase)
MSTTQQQEDEIRSIVDDFVEDLVEILENPEVIPSKGLTKRGLLELVSHEGIVQEAYKDSRGIWTWGIGVTSNSGHTVNPRYKDNPVSIDRVLEVFQWLIETKYLPAVQEVMGEGVQEHELAAAVSFHYNTGAIKTADWVKAWKNGDTDLARRQFMNWKKPESIIPRREKERDLFFDGKWSGDGKSTVYTKVNKPSYVPDWASGKRMDISDKL